jgi:pimeloyl-ACP methyl ester carboxylesterase
MRTVPVPPPVRQSFDHLRARSRDAWTSIGERLHPRRKAPAAEPAPANRPIVLIHGLNVPRQVMIPIGLRLSRQYKRPCFNLSYPGVGHDIPTTAQYVADQIRELGFAEYDAVTHSMGGVVLRWAVANHELPPLRRAVLIAPPNNGAWMADYLHRRLKWMYPIIFGEAGMQLRRGTRGLMARTGTLHGAEVGIIAGGSGTPEGLRNWFGIPGDADGTVAVEETIMSGMKDFALVNTNHSLIGMKGETARLIDHFLTHGVFRHRKHGHHE